jgi:hypothetical protein
MRFVCTTVRCQQAKCDIWLVIADFSEWLIATPHFYAYLSTWEAGV